VLPFQSALARSFRRCWTAALARCAVQLWCYL